MADTRITIKNSLGQDVPVDSRTTPDGDERQVLLVGDGELAGIISPATEDTLAAVLAALGGGAAPTNLPGASGAVTSGDGRLMGFSVREAAGTPAKAAMRLRAGGVGGAILATVTLAPEESVRDWFGPNGITATGGVYYELVSGTITGGVQTR